MIDVMLTRREKIMFNLFQAMTSKRGRRIRSISILIILLLVAAMVLTSLIYAVP